MNRRMQAAEPFPGAQDKGPGPISCCQWRGCTATGEFRAPANNRLNEYYVFCLDHVRQYNAQWDYHRGMSDADLEREFRSSATWDRPTWPMGPRRYDDGIWASARDPFETWRDGAPGARTPPPHRVATPEEEALAVFDLANPVTLTELKARYKDLVKIHHPDANGGSAEAEATMKQINAAYQTLRASLTD